MIKNNLVKLGTVFIALALLSSCANTIRGVGRDAAGTVDATQNAGRHVAKAAQY
nr:entericidin [uncultured Gellertiella sp.]